MQKRKMAIISGGCGGVGRAAGKQLAEDGFNVVALYHTMPQKEAEAVIKTFGTGDHKAVRCDIRDEAAVADVIADIIKKYGSLGVAVHAAVDPIVRKNLLDMDAHEFEGQFGAGVLGGFCFLKEAGRVMKGQESGVLIGLLSRVLLAGTPHPRMGGYVVAKYAARGLLAELDRELAPFAIAVNGIAPDFMDTQLNTDLPKEIRQFIVERGTMGSIKTPDDVARAVSLLSSEKGKALHGKIFSFEESEISPL
jgi:3-oxoacyl-[acyl-carrier protein] reductase